MRKPDVRQLSLFGASPGPDVAAAERDAPGAPPPPPSQVEAARVQGDPMPPPPDAADRDYAVDPAVHVVLEASAGTGKTSVLVKRYCNLLKAGVDPGNILAITFTRKAAAEMRERIVRQLRADAAASKAGQKRWLELRDRIGDIAISTIDAFCLSLLREFPLEADLDPSFRVADDTEIARLTERALDQALRTGRAIAPEDDTVALVLTEMSTRQLRTGLRHLLDRRCVAMPAIAAFLARSEAPESAAAAVDAAIESVRRTLADAPGGVAGFLTSGPDGYARFRLLRRDIEAALAGTHASVVDRRRTLEHLSEYFLTQRGEARAKPPFSRKQFHAEPDFRRHKEAYATVMPAVVRLLDQFDRDVNAVLVRGVQRLAVIAQRAYLRSLDEDDELDFTETLERAVRLLEQMDEFSRSRFRLESRYHHVLVDEFQDTSRLQWRLVSLLVEAWRAGDGAAADAPLPPTVFVVGDRKQSIYRFRDADVSILDEASRHIATLRPNARPHRAITTSFRSAPAILAFVNDVFDEMEKSPGRSDAFRYDDRDRFPVLDAAWARRLEGEPRLGLAVGTTPADTARRVGDEIVRLIASGATVRDRDTGESRAVQPGDIAILFRSRESHRDYEAALTERGVPTYVYKGLGFFGADEIQDLSSLIRFLAQPDGRAREAAFLRSRFVRLSDAALVELARDLGSVLRSPGGLPSFDALEADDRAALDRARAAVHGWLALADRVPPADLVDGIVRDTAYAFELRGARYTQARENVKKFRALLRRIQNRGYATLGRIADHLDRLSAGDESNAAVDAVNAVNLMTVHASKGLEFPVIFVVNLTRGTGNAGAPIRVVADDGEGQPAVSIGALRFEADEEEKRRDREETKRLLYVAVTRARDRLYLATSLGPEGGLAPTPGSLAEVLPRSFMLVLGAASEGEPEVTWASGTRVHRFLRCAGAEGGQALAAGTAPVETRIDVLGRVTDTPFVRATSVRALVQDAPAAGDAGPAALRWDAAGIGDALAGRLVHRLFQALDPQWAGGPAAAGANADVQSSRTLPPDGDRLASVARRLVLDEERAVVQDLDEVVASACATWRALRGRPDVEALFAGAEASYEVPFSLRLDGPGDAGASLAVVRGAIDCLVVRPDGEVIVVEIKTGRPAPWHHAQLALYVRAAGALMPGARVRGVLLGPVED